MADKAYRVVKSDVKGMNEKIQRHRRKILRWTAFVTVCLLLGIAGVYIYLQTRTYSEYSVLKSVEREDSPGAQFDVFHGNILKYSKDGASLVDENNKIIWNQTYEMQAPMVDFCENYAAIADKKGDRIYIMDLSGPCGEIETSMPIQRIEVASQGMVAVLMEQNGTGYIQMYDKSGTFLAEGEVHTENSGYPLDIAISNDGKKLAVSLLDVNKGNVNTTITFFNFDAMGQNEIDNIVGQYSYADMVVPKVEFLTNDVMVAFGSQKAVVFEGAQKPQVKKEVAIEKEIRTIFYNDAYFGFVFDNENKDTSYNMQIHDLRGAEVLSKDFEMEYEEIGFLENDEICIRNDLECAIFTLRGVQKFHANFDKSIWKIMSVAGIRDYVFLIDGETQRIRLK
ncbi:hypothetical protein C806_00640 [Lachnospiraceae bacterium 3-1]|nr:hypothetical protein C806_00640 [Lachnospiraceae bacterium 3-1]